MEREARTGVLKAGRGRSKRGRSAVPRGELAGAWPPRGVRALARSGECMVNGHGAQEQERGVKVG